MAIIPAIIVIMWFIGMILMAKDEVDAVSYIAEQGRKAKREAAD